ncbi:adenylate/guanylate cyclase domain-containing protein [Variovorax sp. YR216]|uniref:adenylate/guanylate cyclase domain-containing protein n=1 Tax=Variovorax sp. YR216 TaxID=1882828 RepID=UPI00089DA205|nr:adenylate/guanylate cyclase domain-containing protein [Variovorax sp. YR216]SEB24421.1 SAM domain (Sterile alpha motif) [Variovorax sp. YR216]
METLSTWLGKLGLDRYVQSFEVHGVDMQSLPLLAESDLAALGVLLGHRKLLLRAIAALDTGTSTGRSLRVDSLASEGSSVAERRQITVLFCDLVGSTEMANNLDPEVLRDLMHAYQKVCGGVIEQYAGHVAQYLGDGLMAYFGWPQAHEDDAERAVHAAREIVSAVGSIPVSKRLQVRIGIATGPVVIGGTGTGDASVPKAAVGPTPNLAARLQGLADADQILVAPDTRHLLGQTFELVDLGPRMLKGIAAPVQVSRVLDVGRAEGRFEATRASGLTPFVGRDRELEKLLVLWKRARAGEGQVVLISGEPGIGKSRIAHVLQQRIESPQPTRIRLQCSSYHVGSALYPFIAHLERAAGFERGDPPEIKLDKLESVLVLEGEQKAAAIPLFASLLSLPIERYPPRVLSPQRQKEATMAALADQVVRATVRQPVLMIVEDLHWADPSTIEALNVVLERIRDAAVMMIMTYRPEFSVSWSHIGHLTTLALDRLSHEEGKSIVEHLTAGKDLPSGVLAQIISRADGVPLFIEELAKTVVEASLPHGAQDQRVFDGVLVHLDIPATLRDSLASKLDRLGQIKEIAQIAACIGREFATPLLAAIVPMSDDQLQRALVQLAEDQMIKFQSCSPDATYSFIHALVQDAAYESLLKSRRQIVHGQIARALESQFPDIGRSQPELVALHFTKAGLTDEAVPRWLSAARLASLASRHREAIGHVYAGLAIVNQCGPDQRVNFEVALRLIGGVCHFALAGFASEAAMKLFEPVESMLDEVTDLQVLCNALSAIGFNATNEPDYRKAVAAYERLEAVAQQCGDEDLLVFARSCLGTSLYHVAQLDRARQLLQFVVSHYEERRHLPFIYLTGADIKTYASAWLGMICTAAGDFAMALTYARMGVAHAKEISHPFSVSLALAVAVLPFAETAHDQEASRLASECVELCRAQSAPFFVGWATVFEGVACYQRGDHVRAADLIEQGMAYLRAMGVRSSEGYLRAWRAMALAQMSRFDEARREAGEGRAACQRSGEAIELPLATYARGLVDLLDPDVEAEEAASWLQNAVMEARACGHRLVELRASTRLAQLLISRGRIDDAREVLAPVCQFFADSMETGDVRQAREVLAP